MIWLTVAASILAIAPRAPSTSAEHEIAGVRAHLAGAESFLGDGDLSLLGAAQRARRAVHVARLAAYRTRGQFPLNDGRHAPFTPIFRDDRGTLCAMGQLLWESGERALVDRIAATRNYATIRELADEPGLAEWLRREGITLEEAARIQPAYWAPDAGFTTPPYSVEVATCSPPVRIEILEGWHDEAAAELPLLPGVGFFGDADCTTQLPESAGRWAVLAFPEAQATFHFASGVAGELEIEARFWNTRLRQTHSIVPAGVHDTGEKAPDAGVMGDDAGSTTPVPGPQPGVDELPVVSAGCAATPAAAPFGLALLTLVFAGRLRRPC